MTVASFFSGIGNAFKSSASASASAAKRAVGGLPFLLGGGLCRYSEFWECVFPCVLAFWLGVVAVLVLLACCACAAGARWWRIYTSRREPAEPEVEVPPPTQVFHGGPVRGGLRKRPLSGGPRPEPGAGVPLLRRGVDKWRPAAGRLCSEERPPSPEEEERAVAEDPWAAASRPRTGGDR